jgi:hypothetical protein
MVNVKHGEQTIAEGIHTAISYEYADLTARLSAGSFKAADKNKLAIQLDDNSVWILLDPLTPTWGTVTSGGGSSGVQIASKKYSSGTIAAGRFVYIAGYDGTFLLIEEALADGYETMPSIGITSASITDSVSGYVKTQGLIESLVDTSSFYIGESLYLSSVTPGEVTNIEPTNSDLVQLLGFVESIGNPGNIIINSYEPRWVATNAPAEITDSTNTLGTVNKAAKEDHTHSHGNRGGGSLHAVATPLSDGFLSATDKAALDALEMGNVTVPVRNETGSVLLKGRAVYVTDWDSPTQVVLVDYADKDDSNKRPAIAVLNTDIPNNTTGTGTLQGIVIDVDTSTFATTDQLVLGNNGAFVRPPPDNTLFTGEVQNLGFVGRVHASQGTIVVAIDGLNPVIGDQVFALAGTSGSPSNTNKYVTNSDTRMTDDRTASGLRTTTGIVSISGATAPTLGQTLVATSGTNATWQTVTFGDVFGPASSTNNAVARFDLTTGKIIKNSIVLIDDTGIITGVSTVNGVTIETHASRHNPGGADALALGIPVAIADANAAGTATSFVRSDHVHALGGTVGGDLNGTLPNPTVKDLTITSEVQGSILYFNGSNWVQLSPGTSGEVLKTQGAAANPIWDSVLTAPIDPTEDGYVAIGDAGDLVYVGGVNDGDVLTWNDSLKTWEPQIINSKKLVIVEFTLTDDINNSTQWFTTWRGSGGDTSSQKLSGSNTGLQNQNACSPFQVPFNSTIIKALLTLKGAGVQNGSVTYPVSYQVDLFSEGFTSETKIGDIDFSISNSYTVGTYSVGDTNFKGSTTLSIDVNEGDMLALKFINGTGASLVGQTRNAFITLLLEER